MAIPSPRKPNRSSVPENEAYAEFGRAELSLEGAEDVEQKGAEHELSGVEVDELAREYAPELVLLRDRWHELQDEPFPLVQEAREQ
jgi:hypothetical protein